jgi:cell division protein FtsQ
VKKGRPQPRRRRKSPARRLRPFWFLIAIAVVLAGIGAYLLATWPALYPHTVEVEGNRTVSKEAIVGRAQIDLSKNMWLQNTGAMAARIESLPYIDRAVIHRRPPDTIVITVTERTPYAFVDDRGTRVTIDHSRRVLQDGAPPDLADSLPAFALVLPQAAVVGNTIDDPDLQTLVGDADALAAAHLDARSLGFDRFGDVTVQLRSGITVLLGDRSGSEQKVPLIRPILEKVERGKRRVAALDLRAMTTPVVVYAK